MVRIGSKIHAQGLFVDGSFVTEKNEPDDIDAVILLPSNFRQLLTNGSEAEIEMEYMLLTRQPEEIFGAEDADDWNQWLQFFMQTREADNRTKGIVEIEL